MSDTVSSAEKPVPEKPAKKKRGFAAMDPAKQAEVASKGGKAAHAKGTAHQFTSETAREAGRKGGQKAQENKTKREAEDGSQSE